MFKTDQKLIGDWARSDAGNMRDVYRFVLLTIRTSLARAVEDARADHAADMTGANQAAYAYADDHRQAIYDSAMAIFDGYHDPEEGEAQLVSFFAGLPGLGLVKAGFFAQLAFGVGGCLDGHNLERFGISQWTFAHLKKRSPCGRIKFARRYCDMIRTVGGTAALWDGWCNYVAGRSRNDYTSAAAVSAAHAEAFFLV